MVLDWISILLPRKWEVVHSKWFAPENSTFGGINQARPLGQDYTFRNMRSTKEIIIEYDSDI
jgi:hypothetical protein